jgi:hypothetical protein
MMTSLSFGREHTVLCFVGSVAAPRWLFLLLGALLLSACGDSSDNIPAPLPQYLPIAQATIENPPPGNFYLQANGFDLADVGYEAEEYFVSGTASSFINLSELGTDGLWEVETADQAEYVTRIVVHRPIDAGSFSGTALVEWLNVTSGFDIPPSWGAGHVEIYRQGHIWVAVSAQRVGIEGRPGGFPLYLKGVDPDRYGGLEHPGDSFAYDLFSQVGEQLRNPQGIDPLNGMRPDYVLAMGESQSAFYLTTYINALQLAYNPYDGYIVHSRGGGAANLSQAPQAELPLADGVQIRVDVNVPVITFETETDILPGNLGYISARQEDTENFRLWEVTGTAHADLYTIVTGRNDATGEIKYAAVEEVSALPGFVECDLPFNAGPMHYVFNTAIRALDNWVRTGQAPPSADRLDVTDDQSAFLIDGNGNVTGGIRTPYVDAPSAILSGIGNTGGGFCRLFGTTSLFSAAQMASLYVDADGFTAAVTAAANEAVAAGFLLQVDADAVIAWAPQQWAAQVP